MNNYFPHDSNARNSDKLIPLRARFGAEGYGIYFMLIERLREEPSYMSVKDYNMLAFDFRVDAGKVKSVVEDFGLFAFTDDGKCFYSESLLRRMKLKDDKSEKARQSAKSRWNKKEKTANADEIACERIANADEIDAIKLKETKEKESKREIKNFSQKNDARDSFDSFLNFLKSLPPDEITLLAEVAGVEPCNFMPLAELTVKEWQVTRRALPRDESDFLAHLVNVVRRKAADNRQPPESAEAKLARSRRQRRAEKEQAETARAEAEKNISKGAQGWAELIRSKGLPPDTSPTDYYRLSDSKH